MQQSTGFVDPALPCQLMFVTFTSLVTRVRRCEDHLLSSIFGKYGKTRNSCLLLVKKGNASHHQVFWSLGTLSGLKDWVQGLVASKKGISTPNTP
jgi:hypothetical protein